MQETDLQQNVLTSSILRFVSSSSDNIASVSIKSLGIILLLGFWEKNIDLNTDNQSHFKNPLMKTLLSNIYIYTVPLYLDGAQQLWHWQKAIFFVEVLHQYISK